MYSPTTQAIILTKRYDLQTHHDWAEWDLCVYLQTTGTWGAYLAILLSIAGMICNAILLYTLTRSVVLRGASSNHSIFSIGVGNILLLLLSAPPYIKHEFDACWTLGISACKFYAFAEVFAVSGISFSVLLVNYEAYRVTTGSRKINMNQRWMLLACIWLGALLFAAPSASFADLAFDNFCRVRPHFEPQGRAYILCQCLFVYLIPFVLNILLRIWPMLCKNGDYDGNNTEIPHHTPKQLNIATAVMTLTMTITWLLFYIFNLGVEFQTLPFDKPHIIITLFDAQYNLLYFNAALCPFILWVFSGMHREAVLEEACCGGQCFARCGTVTGDRYSAFRNEFDLEGNEATEMPNVANANHVGMHRKAVLEEACCRGQCFARSARVTGDCYSAFRNEFDLEGNKATEMPNVMVANHANHVCDVDIDSRAG